MGLQVLNKGFKPAILAFLLAVSEWEDWFKKIDSAWVDRFYTTLHAWVDWFYPPVHTT